LREQKIIETEWPISKLLVTKCDYKMLFYKAGKHGLYVQSITPTPVVYEKRRLGIQYDFGDPKTPHIMTVRSADPFAPVRFVQAERAFRAAKIFKHGLYFPTLELNRTIGFVCEVTKNMLHLRPGSVFRIKCDNRDLRDVFYEKAKDINGTDNLNCRFDYDVWDYTLDIRTYKRYLNEEFHTWAIVTILYGFDLLNHWNMG